MAWEFNGIVGDGAKAPSLAGSFDGGICLVMGGAACVWWDIAGFTSIMGGDFKNEKEYKFPGVVETMGINDIGAYFKPRLNHLASHHAEQLAPTVALRGPNDCSKTHTYTHAHKYKMTGLPEDYVPAQFTWEFSRLQGGTSALLAVFVALAVGYNKVVLAGCPLDKQGHFFDPPSHMLNQFQTSTQSSEWAWAERNIFNNRVRSMSGRTASWLMPPSMEWLNAK